jgi:hypothetical protein
MRRTFAIIAVLVLVLVSCSSDSASDDQTAPTAIYSGTGCSYDGPDEFDLGSTVTFTFTNESETRSVGFAVWRFPSGVTPEEILDEGITAAIGEGDDFYEGAWPPTFIDTPYELTVQFDTLGQNGINCFDQSGGDHNGDGLDYVTMFTVK